MHPLRLNLGVATSRSRGSGLRRSLAHSLCAGAALMASAGLAHAQWTYAGNSTLNAAQVYDGLGVDSALNPRSQGATSHINYVGNGGTGSLTVASGSLTMIANDFKFGRNSNASNGTLVVTSGASFRIEQTNQWGGGIGIAGNNTNSVVGTATIAGTLTWFLSGSSEQSFAIGSGGANTQGTVTLNGGTFILELDAAQALTQVSNAGLRIGAGGAGRGTVNLNAGLFSVRGTLFTALGGQWTTATTTPTFSEASGSAGTGVININNGRFEQLGSSYFAIGTGDSVSFTVGGSGALALLGWDSTTDPGYTKFKALIDAGKIRLNGLAVAAGDYSGFQFSDEGSLGVLKAVNTLVAPVLVESPISVSRFVGESFSFSTVVTGNPAPTLQWEVSTDGGVTWSALPGATSATLAFAPLTFAHNGSYRIVASNSQGTVTSAAAVLTVSYPAPVLLTSPQSRTLLVGASTVLSATASGLGTLTYQWLKDGVEIPGATAASLALDAVQSSSAGVYRLVVTDHAAEASGQPATTTTVDVVVGVLDVAAPSQAISLNFVGSAGAGNVFGGATDLGTLAPAELAGVLPVANWNNSATVTGIAAQTTPKALLTNTGATSFVTATWSAANTWAVLATGGTAASKSADGRLLHGYIERRATVAPGASSVSFAQIPYGTYDVYVYLSGGSAGNVAQVSATASTTASVYTRVLASSGVFPGFVQVSYPTLAEAQASGFASNFVRLSGLTGASLTVALADAVSGQNAGGLAGVSIVDTTPAGTAYPPVVTQAPQSQFVRAGSAVTLAAAATSTNAGGSITYQWLKDGVELAGATGSSLVFASTVGNDSGRYSVRITDTSSAVGSPTSALLSADLVVLASDRSALLNVDLGSATSSLAVANGVMSGEGILRTTGIPASSPESGIGTGLDQWNGLTGAAGALSFGSLKDSTGLSLTGVSISVAGAGGVVDDTSNKGALGSVTTGSGPLLRDYLYTDSATVPLAVTIGGLGAFAGNRVTLVVYAVGVLSTFDSSVTTNDAATVTFGASNNYLGTAPIATSNVDGRDLAYNTHAYATFEGIVSPSGTVVFSLSPDADAGRIPLNGFQLLLTTADAGLAPSFTAQPASLTRIEGLAAAFSAEVTASPAASLQWEFSSNGISWTPLPGATGTSLSLAAVSPASAGSYRLVATNSVGSANSAVATLTVQSFPAATARAIGVNWSVDSASNAAASDVLGVVPLARWDNRKAATQTFLNLVDSSGEPTDAFVQLGTGGAWRSHAAAVTVPFQQLFKGYWDITPGAGSAVGSTATLTVTGLTYTSYDVYVYCITDGPDATRTFQLSLNGGAPVYGKAMGSSGTTPVPLYVAEASASAASSASPATHVRFTGATGSAFTVTATKVDGNYGIAGIQIVNTGVAAPAAPTGLVATAADGAVSLSWASVAGATGYHVYRSTLQGGPYTRVASLVAANSHVDTGLTNGTTYYYVVKAVNEGGASELPSAEVSAVPGVVLSALQSWRLTYFGTQENSGAAADAADPDGDGQANLLEYAFGSDPTVASASPAVLGLVSGALTLTFPHRADPALVYTVEATADLAGTWTTVQTYTGYASAGSEIFTDTQTLPVGGRRFLRLRVTLP